MNDDGRRAGGGGLARQIGVTVLQHGELALKGGRECAAFHRLDQSLDLPLDLFDIAPLALGLRSLLCREPVDLPVKLGNERLHRLGHHRSELAAFDGAPIVACPLVARR